MQAIFSLHPNFSAYTVEFIPSDPGEPCCSIGDVTMDGIINVLDIVTIVNLIMGSP